MILLVAEGIGKIYQSHQHKRKQTESAQAEINPKAKTLSPTVVYKGSEVTVEKPENTFRVVVLGGSAAEGFGGTTEKAWWYLLRNKIQESPAFQNGESVEFINMARGANTTVDDYVLLIQDALPLHPDLVLVYSGWNDLAAFMGNPGWIVRNTEAQLSRVQKGLDRHQRKVWLKKRVFLFKKYVQIKEEFESLISSLYALRKAIRNHLDDFLAKKNLWNHHLFEREIKLSNSAASAVSFETILSEEKIDANYFNFYELYRNRFRQIYRNYFKANLELIAETLREHNIEGVFAFQPDLIMESFGREFTDKETEISRRLLGSKTDLWKVILRDNYPLGAHLMMEVADKYQLHYIYMQNFFSGPQKEPLYLDNVHYSEHGNKVIADLLYRFFESRILASSKQG